MVGRIVAVIVKHLHADCGSRKGIKLLAKPHPKWGNERRMIM